jgi:hypothetical protein
LKRPRITSVFEILLAAIITITEGNNVPPPRGDSDKLRHTSKGKFLRKIELMKRFYPAMKERVWCFVSDNNSCQYLSHRMNNVLNLKFSADEIRKICKKWSLRNMKCISTVLNFVPDICRQEPVSTTVLTVLVHEKEAEVKENIL